MFWPQANTFRSKTNYLAACGTELAAPLLRRYARRFTTQAPTPPAAWRKALLLGANHIGDLLYRSSSLDALHRGLPQCQLDFLAPAPANDVLVNNPAIHTIHALETPPAPGSDAFRALTAEQYDAAICYDSGSYLPWLRLAVQLGIPNRVAYVHKGFSAWVTHPVSIRFPQPFPAYFRDLVAQLTTQRPDWSLRPQVFPTPEDAHAAEALWQQLGLNSSQPTVACFVTTRQPTGIWPVENYLETLRRVHRATPIQIVLCGASSDAPALERLAAQLDLPCRVNAGRLGLRATVAFLRCCRVALTTDSGSRHLANAAHIPTVFPRNLRSLKIETGVYLDSECDLAPDVECIAPDKQSSYLASIQPQLAADLLASKLLAANT